jgi:hypothetical protein
MIISRQLDGMTEWTQAGTCGDPGGRGGHETIDDGDAEIERENRIDDRVSDDVVSLQGGRWQERVRRKNDRRGLNQKKNTKPSHQVWNQNIHDFQKKHMNLVSHLAKHGQRHTSDQRHCHESGQIGQTAGQHTRTRHCSDRDGGVK